MSNHFLKRHLEETMEKALAADPDVIVIGESRDRFTVRKTKLKRRRFGLSPRPCLQKVDIKKWMRELVEKGTTIVTTVHSEGVFENFDSMSMNEDTEGSEEGAKVTDMEYGVSDDFELSR